MDQAISFLLLLATGAGAGLTVWLVLKQLETRSRMALWTFVLSLWVVFLAAWWFVDVNFPLAASEYRNSTAAPPMWLAVGIWFVRFAALASLLMAFRYHSRIAAPEPVAADRPKNGSG